MEHELTEWQQWEDCGTYTTHISCTCGYTQHGCDGGGCWQYNHQEEIPLELDATHQALYEQKHEVVIYGPPEL